MWHVNKMINIFWTIFIDFQKKESHNKRKEGWKDMKNMTGYQQGILIGTGCYNGDRYCVRNIDKWYCEAVTDIYDTKMYSQKLRDKTQYILKSSKVTPPGLTDITDFQGFCRAWIELHGLLDITNKKNRSGKQVRKLRLRIYGKQEILEVLMDCLPGRRKKIQHISNSVAGGYIGQTCAIYFQSATEIKEILCYINGQPKNLDVWNKWGKILEEYRIISNGT